MATTPLPPPDRTRTPASVAELEDEPSIRAHPLFDEKSEDDIWRFLDSLKSEEHLREHMKSRTPVPGGADLVLMWRLKSRVDVAVDGVSKANERISRVEGMLQILMERGQWAKHLAAVCKVVSGGIARVVESIVSDTWVKRTLAFAILLAVMGRYGFTYFNASKGDAELNIGADTPEAVESDPAAAENFGVAPSPAPEPSGAAPAGPAPSPEP